MNSTYQCWRCEWRGDDTALILEHRLLHIQQDMRDNGTYDEREWEEYVSDEWEFVPGEGKPLDVYVDGTLDSSVWDDIRTLLVNDLPRAHKLWDMGPARGYTLA